MPSFLPKQTSNTRETPSTIHVHVPDMPEYHVPTAPRLRLLVCNRLVSIEAVSEIKI